MTHLLTKPELLNIVQGYRASKMAAIGRFFDAIIGPGIYLHLLPRACQAIQPILQEKLSPTFSCEIDKGMIAFNFTEADIERFWMNMARP